MNPEGENLGTCGLEGIKGSSVKLPEMDLEFDTWLGVSIHALIPLIRLSPKNPGI